MKQERFIKIHLSDKQYQVYKEALEFYSRFLSGQVEDLPKVLRKEISAKSNLAEVQEFMRTEVRRKLFQSDYIQYGVGWSDDLLQQEIQISYEMYREAIHQDHVESGKGGKLSVPTLHYSNEPLPIIEKLF